MDNVTLLGYNPIIFNAISSPHTRSLSLLSYTTCESRVAIRIYIQSKSSNAFEDFIIAEVMAVISNISTVTEVVSRKKNASIAQENDICKARVCRS